MKSILFASGLLILTLTLSAATPSEFPPAVSPTPTAIATFHCLGLYWSPPQEEKAASCAVQYREAGTKDWKQALPLWWDERNREYRGSIVNLKPGTRYEITLSAGQSPSVSLKASTWPEKFPITKTVVLPPGEMRETLTITEGGSENGYVLYTSAPDNRTTLLGENRLASCVVIKASYVIVRNLVVKGAQSDAIRLEGATTHVVIEDCDISEWGRIAADGWGVNMDSGIRGNAPGISHLVIQRNRIHHPRSNSNDWSQARPDTGEKMPRHPNGPQAISFFNSAGNNVIRYNEIFSDENHRFNDGIGGGANFSYAGFPGPDSDVYGNIVRNVADDGLEIEGGGRNVRVWGNYLDHCYMGIATAACTVGPLYLFRNILNVSRLNGDIANPDNRGSFLKAGDNRKLGDGRLYLFHNTVLQPTAGDPDQRPLGARVGIGDWGGPLGNVVTRNNIWWVTPVDRQKWNHKMDSHAIYEKAHLPTNDFDYDLYSGNLTTVTTAEAHGIRNVPVFAPGLGLNPNGTGTFFLQALSPGQGSACSLPNFNQGVGADMGAHQSGTPIMEFGVNAYTDSKLLSE